MTRALVTGGGGFVGQWLVRALLRRGATVTSLAPLEPPARWVLDPAEREQVQWISADVRSSDDLGAALDAAQPDLVFHLAALAFPPDSARAPLEAYDVNLLGFVRLAHELAARRSRMDPAVVVVGSAEQYGRHGSREPVGEETPLRPQNVYAATKTAQEYAALQSFLADGLKVVMTRSFNHSGPGHAPQYLLPSLVTRVLELRAAGGGTLRLGNLDVTRDYTHVADVAEAYCLLGERGVPGEAYNVCSGSGVTVRELAESVLHRMGARAEISSDPHLVRPADIPALVGSPAKIREVTGWEPRLSREDIIDDLIRWIDAAS
jgi:GDP-4-dehydro-6-deoxy-D-mannose reductase